FLEEFGDTVPAPKAKALLEALRFNAAKEKGTAQALRQFLRDHPDGKHKDEAQGSEATSKLDDRAFSSATTAGALYAYLREFPAGAHRDQAKVRLLDLKIQGLLVSGEVAEAKAEAQKSPLGAQLPQLK